MSNIISDLNESNKNIEEVILFYLNKLSVKEKWIFIKLILGGLRVGVSSKIIKKSLAKYGNKDIHEIENIWNGISVPYNDLFLWLDNKANQPIIDPSKTFHSFMLATSFDKKLINYVKESNSYFFEYKWDGIRVQIVVIDNKVKIYSRSGDDISNSFPEIKIQSKKLIIFDGEMLVGKNKEPLPFNQLQKRINKKNPSKALLNSLPSFVKVYDILYINGIDIRNKDLFERRKILENWFKVNKNNNLDLSELVNYYSEKKLKETYDKFLYIEGLMIKNKSSKYISGRKKGFWYKWKRNPKHIDTILMYAQRGHGKRSSYYSDYTLGIWLDNKVVPIAKAYSGYTNEELNKIDKFIRKNTIAKFGPVREVEKSLVIEIAFDDAQYSNRHKSGISLRFPRINRIRWDKPANEVLNLVEIKKEIIKE